MKKNMLLKLLKKYEKDLKQKHYEYLEDYIAIKVILELIYPNEYISLDTINDITLNYLLGIIQEGTMQYKVPSLKYINDLYNQDNKYFEDNISISLEEIYKKSALLWIKLMVELGFIKEEEIIDLGNYKLVNMIHDPLLLDMFGLDARKGNSSSENKISSYSLSKRNKAENY